MSLSAKCPLCLGVGHIICMSPPFTSKSNSCCVCWNVSNSCCVGLLLCWNVGIPPLEVLTQNLKFCRGCHRTRILDTHRGLEQEAGQLHAHLRSQSCHVRVSVHRLRQLRTDSTNYLIDYLLPHIAVILTTVHFC